VIVNVPRRRPLYLLFYFVRFHLNLTTSCSLVIPVFPSAVTWVGSLSCSFSSHELPTLLLHAAGAPPGLEEYHVALIALGGSDLLFSPLASSFAFFICVRAPPSLGLGYVFSRGGTCLRCQTLDPPPFREAFPFFGCPGKMLPAPLSVLFLVPVTRFLTRHAPSVGIAFVRPGTV